MGIKILFKNTLNTFKKKKLQLLAIGLIIALSSFLYTTMFYAIDSLKTPLENFIEVSNQEDFSATMIDGLTEFDIDNLSDNEKYQAMNMLTYTLSDIKSTDSDLFDKIINNRINEFERIYENYSLENTPSKVVNFSSNNDSHKATFYKDSKNINKSFIEEGVKPTSDNEIAITKTYAKNNDLKINDTITIKDKDYKITGYVLFSHTTLPMDIDDFNIDNSRITLALVNDKEYESIKAKESFIFAGVATNKKALDDFTTDVAKTYSDKDSLSYITNMTLTENQMKSGGIYAELEGGEAMTMGISVSISAIAVFIVLMITYKIVKNERIQIGVLKALGYTKYEILMPYIIMLSIISLPLLLIGYFLGIYAAPLMANLYLEFYLIPSGVITTNLKVLGISIFIPLVVILGLSTFLIGKMLSKRAIHLIKDSKNDKVGLFTILGSKILKNTKPQTKFKYSYILANTNKFVIFFFGILLSSMLIIMAFMMSNFFDKMTLDYYNSVDYVYDGYVDMTKDYPTLDDEHEKYISLPTPLYKDDTITVTGLESNNKLHKLFDDKSEDITSLLDDGIIINKGFNLTYNIDIGDTIEVSINDDEYDLEVVGVNDEYSSPKIYMDRVKLSNIVMSNEDFKELTDFDDDEFYTGVYSKDTLSEDDFASVINKNDLLSQTEGMQGFISLSVGYAIMSAVFIAVIVLYVLTTMSVEDNYYSISLLKVMGYSKKEVNSMMLNSYLIYSVISYLISIPITVFSLDLGMKYLAKEFNMILPFEFELWHGICGLIVVMIIFFIGSFAAKRKIEKISLQEVLKSHSE